MANESIMQAFDRFLAHVLELLKNSEKTNDEKYATKDYVNQNLAKIDKVLVNGNEQPIGTDKSINIDLSEYATKDYVSSDGGKIDKILLNGVEQVIDDKTVNIVTPGSTETTDNTIVYLTGVTANDGESYYNKSINMNPGTGTINATVVSADKVYGAVWNDYAEWFEKEDLSEQFVPGDICSWNKTGVVKANTENDIIVIGVYSDTYGHILGGEQLEDMSMNLDKFVPIALKGRVKVAVSGKVEIGDYIIPSNIPGVGIVDNYADIKLVVGQALESKDTDRISRITIFIK